MSRLKTLITRPPRVAILLKISAVLTLLGLALMVWSMLQPTPMPVILAMSVGQGLGILAFLLFGVSVLLDQIRKQRAKGHTMTDAELAATDTTGAAPHAETSAPSGARSAPRDGSSAREVSP